MFKMPFSGLFIWRTFTSLEWLAQRKYQGRKHGQPQDGFPTEMDVPASVLSPQTPNLRQKYSLGNTQAFATLSGANCWDCPRAGTVPTASLQLPHQLSSAHGPGHAHGNFGFWVPKEFRFPKFIPPGILGPVLGTSVQEENKKSQGLEQEALWGQAEGREGKARWEKQTVNTKDCEQTSALLFDGESILHPAGGYKFLHF